MSDANVDLGGTDVWALHTNFHAQSSETQATSDESVALDSIGDLACSNEHNKGNDYSTSYKYCGTNLVGDLGAFATAFGAVIGTGAAAKIPTGMSLSYPGPGEQPEISVTGHNHQTNNHSATTNPPNTFDISSIIGTTPLGVPDFFAGAGTDASQTSASLDFSMNHLDVEANAGHFVGESITCRVDASTEYEGVVGSGDVTAGNYLQVLTSQSDANEATDTSAVTGHQYIDAS